MNLQPVVRKLPVAGWRLVFLCALYLLVGLLDHDPWKVEDAIHLGVAWEFAQNGDWLSPRIGADAWLTTPPLFHWIAALLGELFSVVLPFPAAARLASALFGAAMLVALSRAARNLAAEGNARAAPLLAIGTLGLLVPIHDAQPLIVLLAAQAGLYLGLTRLPQNQLRGGAITALSIGAGLLSNGLVAALFLLPLPLILLLNAHWRTGRTMLAALLALLAGLALGGLWPLLLNEQSPALLARWWQIETAHLTLQPLKTTAIQDHLQLLGWAAWPALPLALWTIWVERKRLAAPLVFLPLAASLAALIAIALFAEPRSLSHLPLIPPLCLLAAQGIERLRRGAANAFDWFGMMTFTLVASLVWLGGIAMMTGEPARVAKNFTKAEPGFVGQLSWPALIAAALLTALWLRSVFRASRSPWRSVTHWAGGMTLTWALVAALWMPWLNFGKTYRPVSASLQTAYGESDACVTVRGLGDAQKASFRYFTGIPLQNRNDCPWLLVQGRSRHETAPPAWRKVWEGNRAGDKAEKFWLYRRD